VVADVTEGDVTQGVAGTSLLSAGTLIPVVADIYKQKFLETHIGSVEVLSLG
jgi:hypothetical protein